jgi:hypothetical protein
MTADEPFWLHGLWLIGVGGRLEVARNLLE